MKSFLEISALSKSFISDTGSSICVVKDFDLNIREGEFVSLVGHSGCGKSTVLSIIAGLQEATGGGAILAGREVRDPGRDRGVVFQTPCLFPWMSTLENVRLGLLESDMGLTSRQQIEQASHYLELVGLKDSLQQSPTELSQGMRQRVGIARAFALKPKVLLLDEPFGMLDSLTRVELQDVLLSIWESEKITALLVTHDVEEAIYLADRVVLMTSGPAAYVGKIVEVGFSRPRCRHELALSSEFDSLREELLAFLHGKEHLAHAV